MRPALAVRFAPPGGVRSALACGVLAALCLAACAPRAPRTTDGRPAGGTPPADAGFAFERGVDRFGADMEEASFDTGGGGPEACLRACQENPRCRAFTYTDPGFQAPGGQCWLKDAVPDPQPHAASTSGVVRR